MVEMLRRPGALQDGSFNLTSVDGKLRIVLECGSKRRMAVSRSTTEAELVSARTACATAGLPTLSLVEELTDAEVLYKQFIDNEAARLIVLSSKPGKMPHLRKHQRLTVGFLSDVFKEPSRELERVPTDDNTGDLLTKAMARVRQQILLDQVPLVHIDDYQTAPHGADDGDRRRVSGEGERGDC